MDARSEGLFSRATLGRGLLLLATLLTMPAARAALHVLDDATLAEVHGQALLVADQIQASSISGAPSVDSGLTFYRMGLDAKLAFNANINRMQLGCGGINDYIDSGCDLDLSYVRFMGNDGSNGPGNPVSSDFTLTRPYVELAVTGDGSANRQVVGVNIGAQSADGYLGIGRYYSAGQTNQETGQVCTGGNDVNCHSGATTISGNLGFTLSGTVDGTITCFGIGCGSIHSDINNYPLQVTGTRISAPTLSVSGQAVNGCFLGFICLTLYPTLNLTEPLVYLHGAALNNAPDFGLSFERQQVAYPKYDKTGFSATANTGWWMNLPSNVAISGVHGSTTVDAGAAIGGALGIPVNLSNLDLGQRPPKNCFGNAQFC